MSVVASSNRDFIHGLLDEPGVVENGDLER
jgi:hypothetical protein